MFNSVLDSGVTENENPPLTRSCRSATHGRRNNVCRRHCAAGSATEKPAQGEVLAVGPGKRLDSGDTQAVDVNVGDTVVFGKYSSNTVKVGDEELLILNESEIFGVIES